jgi:hypothetical protein
VQVPLHRVVEPNALADQALAVIDEQPQVKLGPVQLRNRKIVQPFAQRCPGDRHRVDAVGLASLAPSAASAGHQLGRDAQNALAARDQEPLEGAGHVPAILKRPDSLPLQAARPDQQAREPAGADLDRLLAKHLTRRRSDRGDRVRALVNVRTEHDH